MQQQKKTKIARVLFDIFYSFFGKNFLKGKSNPARLKKIIINNGISNEDRDTDGRVKLSAIQATK